MVGVQVCGSEEEGLGYIAGCVWVDVEGLNTCQGPTIKQKCTFLKI